MDSCSALTQKDVDEFTDLYLGLQKLATDNICQDLTCLTDKLRTQQMYRTDRFWMLLLLYHYMGTVQRMVKHSRIVYSRLLLKCRRCRRGCKTGQEWYHAFQRNIQFPGDAPLSEERSAAKTAKTPRTVDLLDTEIIVVEFGEDIVEGDASEEEDCWPWNFHLALLVRQGEQMVIVPLSECGHALLQDLPVERLKFLLASGSTVWDQSKKGSCVVKITPVHSLYYALLWLHVGLTKEQQTQGLGVDRLSSQRRHVQDPSGRVSIVSTFAHSTMANDRGAALFEVHLLDVVVPRAATVDNPRRVYDRCVPSALQWRVENGVKDLHYTPL